MGNNFKQQQYIIVQCTSLQWVKKFSAGAFTLITSILIKKILKHKTEQSKNLVKTLKMGSDKIIYCLGRNASGFYNVKKT